MDGIAIQNGIHHQAIPTNPQDSAVDGFPHIQLTQMIQNTVAVADHLQSVNASLSYANMDKD